MSGLYEKEHGRGTMECIYCNGRGKIYFGFPKKGRGHKCKECDGSGLVRIDNEIVDRLNSEVLRLKNEIKELEIDLREKREGEKMITDTQVIKAIDDILRILQPLKDQYDKKEAIKLKVTCERCGGGGTKVATAEKCEWCNGHGFYWSNTPPRKCECGGILDANSNQEVNSGMCQSCLDCV